MENTTIITALYNINREERGDGRKWEDYLEWFKETLQLPLPMIIYVPNELVSFIKEHRPTVYKTHIIVEELNDIPYAYLEAKMTAILNDNNYKQKINHPNRVECKLAFYNIIQYSKFKWLKNATNINPFKTEFFFWMDAGISRFIPRNLYSRIVSNINIPRKKLLMQHNDLYYRYPVNENYLWDSQCLLCGTMFGGDQESLCKVSDIVEYELCSRLEKGWNNNEQILIAFIQKNRPDLFSLVYNNSGKHLCLFDMFFIY